MRPFEYARPQTEEEAVELLQISEGGTAVLAGGTDLISLLKRDLLAPRRVVDIKQIESMKTIERRDDGVLIGALVSLDELAENPLAAEYASLQHVVAGVRSIQVQSMGTVGGDLTHLPNCWYFRNGYGLLGLDQGKSAVAAGDNRYHAILGNTGLAKFVNASRFAPGLISWDARVRIVGPGPEDAEFIPLRQFYTTPKRDGEWNTVLQPGQLVTHIWLPSAAGRASAAYEVMETEGLDWPLAAAAVCLELQDGIVLQAGMTRVHRGPVPWVAEQAQRTLIGQAISEATAERAADIAVAAATPLSDNAYKVRIARTAVKRALLRAVGQLEGGL